MNDYFVRKFVTDSMNEEKGSCSSSESTSVRVHYLELSFHFITYVTHFLHWHCNLALDINHEVQNRPIWT